MNSAIRRTFFKTLQQLNPHPVTELEYTSPFELLIAVLLSAQATDISVNKATRKLYRLANTPEKMLLLGEAGIIDCIKTIGLYRTKAKNIILTSQSLIDRHAGEVPDSRESLEAMHGVGRKTANVVLNIVFGKPTIAVDTHIFRVANRTGLAPGKTPMAVELALNRVTPVEFRQHAHHWLILLGRYVCKARKPECWHCAVASLCDFHLKTVASSTL
ncbi:endonuclease III [Candidatus Pandoraea novymonadis]|uniref:Endonuclease III n=1 Tax=Candidatus Pandoraea novymonadis TaxID=1808959 RepID=A0ABX5FEH9_9BURK|nr:endonuclease III [Candidatus Pandoraea novymonadis]PSB92080.1 Endonuclease III [Candidatus Pandoraea novymonadis]